MPKRVSLSSRGQASRADLLARLHRAERDHQAALLTGIVSLDSPSPFARLIADLEQGLPVVVGCWLLGRRAHAPGQLRYRVESNGDVTPVTASHEDAGLIGWQAS